MFFIRSHPHARRARLVTGEIVVLNKECECVIHTEPHWLHHDRVLKELNRKPLDAALSDLETCAKGRQPLLLVMRGYIQEEILRLKLLQHEMKKRNIDCLLEPADDAPVPSLAFVVAARRKLSYNEMERMMSNGLISRDEWRWYVFIWKWSEPRFSSAAQDRVYARLGQEGYRRRIDRVRCWVNLPAIQWQPQICRQA